MFTAININTSFGKAYYAKDKEAVLTIQFIKVLKMKRIVNVLEADLGNECKNSEFNKFYENNQISLDLQKSDSNKSGIIYRWHRTIYEKLTSSFDANDIVKRIDIINKIDYNSNHTVN